MLVYQRRVSFDSISPEGVLKEETKPRVPPQYKYKDDTSHQYSDNGTKKRNLDLNFGFEPMRKQTDIKEVFNSIDRIGNSNYLPELKKKRKAPKLPPPPKRSILKNYEVLKPSPEVLKPEVKKKSLIGLTDEELIARDAQYRLGVDLEKLKFDGDDYLPSFTVNYQEKNKYDKVKKIDISLGELKAKSKILTNLKSYSVTYKHPQYYEYIQQKGVKNETPDSFRNLMLYLSGRRHTWTGINWCLRNYLRDGDQLIIISQVQEDEDYKDGFKKDIARTSQNLKSYICDYLKLIGKDLKVAFTFEFIKDPTMESLIRNAAEFYQPQVFLIGSLLTNLNITFEEGKKRKKLPVFLFTLKIPTIVIPEQLITTIPDPIELRIPDFGGVNITVDDHDDLNFEKNINEISDSLDQNQDHQPIVTYRASLTSTEASRRGSVSKPQSYTSTQVTFDDNLHPGNHPSCILGSSRRSSSHSARGTFPMQKVKSMLEFDEPTVAPVKLKSNKSNDIQRQKSNEILRSVSLDNGTEKSKRGSIFGGLFGRKKK